MYTSVTLILAAIVLSILAVIMAWILGWANRAFAVEVNPKVKKIDDALPGANCGGCGYVGCGEYAEAVAENGENIFLCGPGGPATVKQIAEIMDMEVKDALPYKAVVHCSATSSQRLKQNPYYGEQTCAAANLVPGVQGCIYGCLGLGDCVTSCDYDAIHIKEGLAVVDYDKCVGCKACARACPRNIISMVPFKSKELLVVACSNKDFGPEVKSVCQVGCIGCKACTRGTEVVKMEDNLPVIDYDAYSPYEDYVPVLEKCKMESLLFVGEPSKKDLEETSDEKLPDRVTADFETTIDYTDWWG